jgi:hypothetical protein
MEGEVHLSDQEPHMIRDLNHIVVDTLSADLNDSKCTIFRLLRCERWKVSEIPNYLVVDDSLT